MERREYPGRKFGPLEKSGAQESTDGVPRITGRHGTYGSSQDLPAPRDLSQERLGHQLPAENREEDVPSTGSFIVVLLSYPPLMPGSWPNVLIT